MKIFRALRDFRRNMITHDSYKQFEEERNAALLSLDRAKIEAYLDFWAGIHKARIQIDDFSDEVKEASLQWLQENGYKEKREN